MFNAETARRIATGQQQPLPKPTWFGMTCASMWGHAVMEVEKAADAGKREIVVFDGDDWSYHEPNDRTAIRERVLADLRRDGFKAEPLDDQMAMRVTW